MKSLYEYLLMEVKAADFGKGWQDISLRGKLSKQAEGILQFSSYKQATAAAANPDKHAEIKKGLAPTGDIDESDPMKFVQSFFQAKSELDEFIEHNPDKDKADEEKVELTLKGQWRIVGGNEKLASSVKVLRFWIESTMAVYGQDTKKIGYAINKVQEKLIVYKK